jgi:hypothetical protein
LDELAKAAHENYRLGRISVRSDAPLLYPAAGCFPLVAKGKDGDYSAGIAIPAGVRHVFVAVPRSLDWDSATAQWAENGAGFVANASVGRSTRVVIHPSAMNGLSHEKIDALIRRMRRPRPRAGGRHA